MASTRRSPLSATRTAPPWPGATPRISRTPGSTSSIPGNQTHLPQLTPTRKDSGTPRVVAYGAGGEGDPGKVDDECYDRHGKAEFLDFLTHRHDESNAWLTKHPRITLHFTPTSGSWLNLVEVFFGIITKQAIRRGSFDSVKELVAAIRTFIECWNERCHPFIWTKTADQILPHATRKPNADAGH
jgi:hypothetical protein